MDDPRLTPREGDVLGLVVAGYESKAIGHELGISEQAVKDHVSALLQKFKVKNRAGLAEAASRLDFTGSLAVERAWARKFFRQAELQICVLRGPELRYATVNDAFKRAVGERALIGQRMRDAFPELVGQRVFERVDEVYATGVPSIESEVLRYWDRGAGLEERRVTLVLQPLRDTEGQVNGVISFAIDVTEEVRTRERGLHTDLAS